MYHLNEITRNSRDARFTARLLQTPLTRCQDFDQFLIVLIKTAGIVGTTLAFNLLGVYCKKIKMHFIYNTEFLRLRVCLSVVVSHYWLQCHTKILWTIILCRVFQIEILWDTFKQYNNKIYLYNSSLHSPLNKQSTLKCP